MQIARIIFPVEPRVLLALQERALPVVCESEQRLFAQGSAPHGLYVLTEGRAQLATRLGEPGFEICFEVTAPSVLGLPALMGSCEQEFTATAMQGARLGFVHKDDFRAMVEADPALSLDLLRTLAASVGVIRTAMFDAVRALASGHDDALPCWSEAAS